MNKIVTKSLLVLSLTLSVIGMMSSCITFQEIAKPNKKQSNHHHPRKKPHSHTTNVTYRFPAPQSHPSNGNQAKGHKNGKAKGHDNGNNKKGKKH